MKNQHRRKCYFFVLLMAWPTFILTGTPQLPNTQNQQPTTFFTETEAIELVNQLLDSVYRDNQYMSELMKDKLNWINTEYAAGRFRINGTAARKGRVLMTAGYIFRNNDGHPPYIPVIDIYTPRLLTLVRIQQGAKTGFNQLSKNTFALSLTHEAIHLERGEEYYTKSHSDEENFDEDVRTWTKVTLQAVRPLRAAGQPLDIDFIQADDVLKLCNDQPDCTEFRDWLKKQIS